MPSNKLSLETLPDDVLLDIFLLLSVLDILSLKQTCRVLYAIGSNDYLWRYGIVPNLRIPLGLSPDAVNFLSSIELQQTTIKAIKLEQNWRKPTSQIKSVTPILHDTDNVSIDEMRLLPGAQWLVTAQRNRPKGRLSTSISFWSLIDSAAIHRAALIEVPGTYRDFAVCFRDHGEWGTLAIGVAMGNQELVLVYKIPTGIHSEYQVHAVPSLIHSTPRPTEIRGVIHEVSVHGDVVAATFATVEGAGHLHQLFLINFNTGAQKLVNPKFTEAFNPLSIRLSHGYIILVGVLHHTFAMRIHELPSSIFAREPNCHSTLKDISHDDIDGLGRLAAEYRVANVPCDSTPDFVISDSINIPERLLCPELSLMVFHVHDVVSGQGHLARFSVYNPSEEFMMEPQLETILPQTFPVPPATSMEIVKLGTKGYRAVFLEHNWEKQQFRLMKLSAAVGTDGEPNVGVILPPDPELPFSPRECQSLAFDEVTGRLCLGLYTGDLYILDFV